MVQFLFGTAVEIWQFFFCINKYDEPNLLPINDSTLPFPVLSRASCAISNFVDSLLLVDVFDFVNYICLLLGGLASLGAVNSAPLLMLPLGAPEIATYHMRSTC